MKRLERALEVAIKALVEMRGAESQDDARTALAKIDVILHPVEVEEIPVERWEAFRDDGLSLGVFDNEEDAVDKLSCDHVVKLSGIIRREKKVVERSVAIEASIRDDGAILHLTVPFWDQPECHGKRGKLTFEWTE